MYFSPIHHHSIKFSLIALVRSIEYCRKMALFSDSWSFDLLMLFISILSLFYLFAKQRYSYWERRGFKSYPDPNFFLGHFKPTFTQKAYVGDLMTQIYKKMNEPFVGIYGIFQRPILVVCDPQAVRTILIKDFNFFTDRTYSISFHCLGSK